MRSRGVVDKSSLALMLVSTLVTFILFEIGARAWLNIFMSDDDYRRYVLYTDIPESERQWSPHHYLNYYPTPGYIKGSTRHNSLGYRNKEFTTSKPDGAVRIVALGGSTTYTIKVDDNSKTFTSQLERVLRNQYGYKSVEVINAGVGGYSSWESLLNLQLRVLDLQPDLVIIYHGVNDIHTRLVPHAFYKGDNSGRRKQWRNPRIALWEHSALLRIISRKLHFTRQVSLGSFVDAETYYGAGNRLGHTITIEDQMHMLNENSPDYFSRNIANMVRISRGNNARVLLSTFAHSTEVADDGTSPVYEQGYRENNLVVRKVADELSCSVYDFAANMPVSRKYWADSVHVSAAGAKLKAELFAHYIHNNKLLFSKAGN